MVKKKIDSRIRTLIENGVHKRERTMVVLVGDRAREQVVNLNYILEKAAVRARPTVLWCYKKNLGFSTHRGKRQKEEKRRAKSGVKIEAEEEAFNKFVSSTEIRYCYYSDTHKILGNTYGMLVLQDFEALSPNMLARTVETIEGGGLIVLLLRTVRSLKQLYTMAMDVHARFRTEAHQTVVPRFNERFLLSLKNMDNCLILDDTLDVVPWAKKTLRLQKFKAVAREDQPGFQELKDVKASCEDTQPLGTLVAQAYTLDQANALIQFADAISEKSLNNTVTLTAARGRGKSATLGLAIATAIAYGYSNVFVTSPSPENLKTLFEFVFKGFEALNYQEHSDYTVITSKDPDHNKAIVRINIFNKDHRQSIQYIDPTEHKQVTQAELLVIDEAAAIPLPVVKNLLGPYLVFMASTVNGYEGTGRSLSLKLINQLRKQSQASSAKASSTQHSSSLLSSSSSASVITSRKLTELSLSVPIRYAEGDPVEAWLNGLLCLDSTLAPSTAALGCPHPSNCHLYSVDRDTLFSYNKVSELFLQRMVAIYVSSHYKNTPNDLQLLSDAPAHRLFCLLAPISDTAAMPEILCVVQVALEGKISSKTVSAKLKRAARDAGDLIPWTVSQQFQDSSFGELSGARVVRVATHPDYQGMGYGKRAIEQLKAFFEGKFVSLSEGGKQHRIEETSLQYREGDVAELVPRTELPPLLRKLDELIPDDLDYIGVSYGATDQLYKFWKKLDFAPVYLRQTANELTGEHTCIMIHTLACSRLPDHWLRPYWEDFRRRYLSLLGLAFRHFTPSLALSVLEPTPCLGDTAPNDEMDGAALLEVLTPHDLKRLNSYKNNMVDFHVIMDLVPKIASLFFMQKFKVGLSAVEQAVLLGMGLQLKTVEDVAPLLPASVGAGQLLGIFKRVVSKVSVKFRRLQEAHAEAQLPKTLLQMPRGGLRDLDEEQEEEGQHVLREQADDAQEHEDADGGSDDDSDDDDDDDDNDLPPKKDVDESKKKFLAALSSKYAITATDEDFEKSLGGKKNVSHVSLARPSTAPGKAAGSGDKKKKGKKHRKSLPSSGARKGDGDAGRKGRHGKEGKRSKSAASTPHKKFKKPQKA